jgi:hypothetical protein
MDDLTRLRRALALARRTGDVLLTGVEVEQAWGLPRGGLATLKHRHPDTFPEAVILGPGWPALYRDTEMHDWLHENYTPRPDRRIAKEE